MHSLLLSYSTFPFRAEKFYYTDEKGYDLIRETRKKGQNRKKIQPLTHKESFLKMRMLS